MKFVAFRVENGALVNHTINHELWTVRGQRETDLNWTVVGVYETEELAKAWALTIRAVDGVRGWCPVYDNAGYGYKDVDPMLK